MAEHRTPHAPRGESPVRGDQLPATGTGSPTRSVGSTFAHGLPLAHVGEQFDGLPGRGTEAGQFLGRQQSQRLHASQLLQGH
jgi:hypothetical protein